MAAMAEVWPPHIVLASLAGWMNKRQGQGLDHLIEQGRVRVQGATQRGGDFD
jgi:hypothetical protein